MKKGFPPRIKTDAEMKRPNRRDGILKSIKEESDWRVQHREHQAELRSIIVELNERNGWWKK